MYLEDLRVCLADLFERLVVNSLKLLRSRLLRLFDTRLFSGCVLYMHACDCCVILFQYGNFSDGYSAVYALAGILFHTNTPLFLIRNYECGIRNQCVPLRGTYLITAEGGTIIPNS